MDNSISIDLNSGNNAMDSLVFHWTAILEDGSKIEQFNSDGIETKFKEVQDNFDKLFLFILKNKDNSKCFEVDLYNGRISFNTYNSIKTNTIKNNIRLINFRTVQKIFSEDITLLKTIIQYKLGFQYNDENNINRKIILIIDEQGNWVIGE